MNNKEVEEEFVRNCLLIKQFCVISEVCDSYKIIPMKGISLLFTIYKDDYYRNIADIDIFIPENQAENFIKKVKSLGYSLRSGKMTKQRLDAKGKFDMINHRRLSDLDVHTDLITKKFFRMTTNNFTSSAMSRLYSIKHSNIEIPLLSPVYEWLFLAQHYCFHFFSNEKWLRDLYLLQLDFSENDITELASLAKKHNFERVVCATHRYLTHKYPANEIKIPATITKKNFLFDILFRNFNNQITHSISDRIIAAYWEFLFIDQPKPRIKSYLRLMFPDYSLFCCIYNTSSRLALFLLYPAHIIITIISSMLFMPLVIQKYRL